MASKASTDDSETGSPDEPERTFDDIPLPAEVRKAVDDLGYTTPSPVQVACFGPAMAKRDVVAQARTGTGKTAAFGLPLISGLVKKDVPKIQAIVLCPTRELALQVCRELDNLNKYVGLKTVAVYGGAPIGKQIDALEGGAQILCGTPGRVLDHIERGSLKLDAVTAFVLDECDEMLSMGFLPQIIKVWDDLPKGHQVMLFSATVPRDVMRIAESRLTDPEFVTLSGDHVGALEIDHFMYMSQGHKTQELVQIVEVENPESAIVFCNTRDDTKKAAAALKKAGFDADWLNAELSQSERENLMKRTREGRLRFLVATDVAARGIDISHLTHVFNYDLPESADYYVHRTGRTGRAGKTGTAISLVSPGSIGDLYYLRLRYKISPVERHLPSQRELKTRAELDVIELILRKAGTFAIGTRAQELAARVLTHYDAEKIVAGLLSEYLGEDTVKKAETERRQPAPKAAPKAKTSSNRNARSSEDRPRREREDRPQREREDRPQREREDRPRSRNSGRDSRQHEEDGIRYEVSDVDEGTDASRGKSERATDQNRRREEESDGVPTPRLANENSEGRAPRRRKEHGDGERPARRERSRGRKERQIDSDMAEVFVSAGKRDGASAEDFLEVLSNAGVPKDKLGNVHVRHGHTFVAVNPSILDEAVAALNGADIGGRDVKAEPARSQVADKSSDNEDAGGADKDEVSENAST
ncbi:MAG: DEAD/DEAH box helicase [Polyangiaceae bacterium]|nr:DEAD/DEAH box helicase [Polyangiaceae bacterium]